MADKIRFLQVRPAQSADLCFEVAGVLGAQHPTRALLGQPVTAFDLPALHTRMRTVNPQEPGRLVGDAARIRSEVGQNYLFSLRNEIAASSLEQAIVQREVAWLERYKHKKTIAAAMAEVYPANASLPSGKLERLRSLRRSVDDYRQAIKAAYETQSGWNPKELAKNVVRDMETVTKNTGKTDADTTLTPVAMKTTNSTIQVRNSPANSDHMVEGPRVLPQTWNGTAWADLQTAPLGFTSQKTVTGHDLSQVSITKNHDYRHPYLESSIADQRYQLELQDELLAHTLAAAAIPEQENILDRELRLLDLEIAKVQAGYIQTFLVSPMAGVITAIYKDAGEAVQPGEPVIRVEDDNNLLLVGVVHYRNRLRVGQRLRVRSENVFESSRPVIVTGSIVSIRGHDSDDDEWDVIVNCKNESDPRLPLNYHFDRETTTFEVA